jgi:hypothetical protein
MKYNVTLDLLTAALLQMKLGNTKKAVTLLASATDTDDMDEAVDFLDRQNDEAFQSHEDGIEWAQENEDEDDHEVEEATLDRITDRIMAAVEVEDDGDYDDESGDDDYEDSDDDYEADDSEDDDVDLDDESDGDIDDDDGEEIAHLFSDDTESDDSRKRRIQANLRSLRSYR